MTHSGGKPHPVGDRGQRYEVSFLALGSNVRKALGWTDGMTTAQKLVEAIDAHPAWSDPEIRDRYPPDGWRSMLTAPKDGRYVELLVRHSNYKFAATDQERDRWQHATRGQWIDFNGGGWTWSGMAGELVAWRPELSEAGQPRAA